MYSNKTDSAKQTDIEPQWWIVDATDLVVGRLAAQVVPYLMGKHKPCYTPHINCGDKVIIINVEKVRFTGKKMTDKTYLSHTGYPGGQRSTTPKERMKKDQAERILEDAIRGMLPKTRLKKPFYKNLHLYKGAVHAHTAQQPKPLTFKTVQNK